MAKSNAPICVQSADEYLLANVREVLGQRSFNIKSERCIRLQDFGRRFLERAMIIENAPTLCAFLRTLLDAIDDIIQESCQAKRESLGKIPTGKVYSFS